MSKLHKSGFNKFRKAFYEEYFHIEEKDLETKIPEICQEYLKGLQYVLDYYFIGCQDWDWYYTFIMPPLMEDLHNYLTQLKKDGKSVKVTYNENSKPIRPFAQLIFIQPK